tara:strand:+ start:284 stop:493 length:210 start_codon:yes stop_codon:yes gene_type:complete
MKLGDAVKWNRPYRMYYNPPKGWIKYGIIIKVLYLLNKEFPDVCEVLFEDGSKKLIDSEELEVISEMSK